MERKVDKERWTKRLSEGDFLAALAGRESNGCNPTNVLPSIYDESRSGRIFISEILSGLAQGSMHIYTARRMPKEKGN
jgi:hypothetical protein